MKYLKIHSLEKGWHDKDEILMHASFQLLVDFVEQEKPDKIIDWQADELHSKAWKEIQLLYKWWKKERKTRKDPLDDKRIKHPPLKLEKIPESDMCRMVEPDRKKYARYYQALKKSWKLELKWEEEDQRNLHRLIDIRKFLWT
ncbi:MAG: hypothetical protein U9N86_13355 [Bacteroidota bacterium]|nr:hypothetical protein [Bacteroidota bacterium]